MQTNALRLVAVSIANLIIYIALLEGQRVQVVQLASFATSSSAIFPVGLCIALLTIAVGILSPTTKARLVFLRWVDPLPGCRAFTAIAQADPRIDHERLEKRYAPIPPEGPEQNALWYREYTRLKDDAQIAVAHSRYLFARDYASLAFLFLCVLGPFSLFQFGEPAKATAYAAGLAAQYLAVRAAAANYGRRFVATVLAIRLTRR